MALSEEDKKEGRFVRISQLELLDQQAVRGWLKGFSLMSIYAVFKLEYLKIKHKANILRYELSCS